MKLLLDENLPHALRREIVGHDVYTAAYMGWSGVENGELLKKAAESQFEALISNDRGLEYQQDVDTLPIAVVVLLVRSNTIESIRPLLGKLHAAIEALEPRTIVTVSAE